MSICYLNGSWLEAAGAAISVQDRGFRFGDGVFETIAVYGGVPYQFALHMQRLAGGLADIRIRFPTESLAALCREALLRNSLREGTLRIQITRGSGSRGYLPAGNAAPSVLIEAHPFPAAQGSDNAILWISERTRISPRALPVHAKLCQGLNSTLARMEAVENGCFDSLLLNEAGEVCETSSGNIFWKSGGRIFTPALSCGVLAGTTRAAFLRLVPGIHEVPAPLSALLEADAVCAANILWQATPVSGCKPHGNNWNSQAFAQSLRAALLADIKQHTDSSAGDWA
jgi:branched-chain amino acid aminotransferase